jgi:hypothetical protein
MSYQPALVAHGTDGHDVRTLLAQSYVSGETLMLDAHQSKADNGFDQQPL